MTKTTAKSVRIPHNYEPRPYQLEVLQQLDAGCRRAFLRWSRRAGKDKTCFCYMVRKAVEKCGIYYYLFPTFAQGRKALWEGIQDGWRLIDHVPKEIIAKIHQNEMRIELVNGSIIRVIGTDNYDSIMGTNPIGMVFSEYQSQDPMAWQYMQPILAQNKGWVIFNGTPRGKNHFYDLEIIARKNPDLWCVSIVQALYPDQDNYYQVVDFEELRAVRASGMTEDQIAQEFGVSYSAVPEGTYYADCIETARKENRIGSFVYDKYKAVDTFWDLGKRDDTVIWFRQQVGNKLVFIDYLEDSGKDLSYYIEAIKAKGYKYRTHWVPHDGAHETIQSTLSSAALIERLCSEFNISNVVQVAPKVSNKQIAINAVRSRFSRYFFDENKCMEGLFKLSLYHRKYDKVRKVFADHPEHDKFSHAADALSTEALAGEQGEEDIFKLSTVKLITDFNPLDYDRDNTR